MVTIIPTDVVTNLLFCSFCPFLSTQNKRFSASWCFGSKKCFCFFFIVSAMPNSIDFHKGIFLHVIPARIIVPWLYFVISRLLKLDL